MVTYDQDNCHAYGYKGEKKFILSNSIQVKNGMCTKFDICNKTLEITTNILTIVQFDNVTHDG